MNRTFSFWIQLIAIALIETGVLCALWACFLCGMWILGIGPVTAFVMTGIAVLLYGIVLIQGAINGEDDGQ